MKKLIFICLLIGSHLFALSAKNYDELIKREQTSLFRLVLKCEHPTKSTPQICIKAGNKMKNTKYSPKYINHINASMIGDDILKNYDYNPSEKDYRKYFETILKPDIIAEMYFNAATQYEKQQFLDKAVKYYEKYLKYTKDNINKIPVFTNVLLFLGNSYVQSNKIKAYEYWMKAARLGNIGAQSNLDILCRRHSWVCK